MPAPHPLIHHRAPIETILRKTGRKTAAETLGCHDFPPSKLHRSA